MVHRDCRVVDGRSIHEAWASRSNTDAVAGTGLPVLVFVVTGSCTRTRLPSGTPTSPANDFPAITGIARGPVLGWPVTPGAPGQVDPANSPVQFTATYWASTWP